LRGERKGKKGDRSRCPHHPRPESRKVKKRKEGGKPDVGFSWRGKREGVGTDIRFTPFCNTEREKKGGKPPLPGIVRCSELGAQEEKKGRIPVVQPVITTRPPLCTHRRRKKKKEDGETDSLGYFSPSRREKGRKKRKHRPVRYFPSSRREREKRELAGHETPRSLCDREKKKGGGTVLPHRFAFNRTLYGQKRKERDAQVISPLSCSTTVPTEKKGKGQKKRGVLNI